MTVHRNTKPDNISIEEMVEDDIESVLEIQSETGLSHWNFQDYKSEVVREDSICVVARNDNRQVIGFAVIRKTLAADSTHKTYTSSEIYNIALSKSFQSIGIGQHIFDKVVTELRNQGILEIWLEVRESNKQAVKFYLKNGFLKQFERKDYYRDPIENACILKLVL